MIEFTDWELVQLRALVEEAFDAKGTPELNARCVAIEAWYRRLFLGRWRRVQDEETDRLVVLLRETDPARIHGAVLRAA